MMLQLIDKSKIYFYLILLFVLLSIHNLNFNNFLSNFFKIDKIILKGDIEEKLNDEVSSSLERFYSYSIFLINSEEIKNILENFNIISEYNIKKEYPSVIKIDLKKTNIIAYYYDNNQKIYIGENGKKIQKKQFTKNDLPIIEGDVDIEKFFELRKELINNGFKLNDFIKFYFNKSKRWDLVYKNQILVKLPINNLNYSISLLKEIIEKTNINGIEIIDLRINNRIILS